MAFWSKLGKGLVKVGKYAVPIALGATGVGIPAAMAAGAGLSALDKKMSGGTWKGALLEGALGAAGGYGGSQLGSGLASALGKNLAKEGVKAGVKGAAGAAAKKAGMSAMGKVGVGIGLGTTGLAAASELKGAGKTSTIGPSSGAYYSGGNRGIVDSRSAGQMWGDFAKDQLGRSAALAASRIGGGGGGGGGNVDNRGGYAMPRYSGNVAFDNMRMNLSRANPIAAGMQRGRMNAILSQPFRMGNAPPEGTSQEEYDLGRPPGGYLPPIFPQGPYGPPRQQYQPPPERAPVYDQPTEPAPQEPISEPYQPYDEEEERRRNMQY